MKYNAGIQLGKESPPHRIIYIVFKGFNFNTDEPL